MDKLDTLRKINEFDNIATKMAVDLIESEARKILSSHDDLYEFVMAMGSCFFVDIHKQNISNNYNQLEDDDMVKFFDMVYSLNERWYIMGYPMRFTTDGPKRNEW